MGFCGRNVIAIKLHFGHHDIIRPHCSRPGVHADGVFHNIGQLGHAGIGTGIITLIHQHGGGEPANFAGRLHYIGSRTAVVQLNHAFAFVLLIVRKRASGEVIGAGIGVHRRADQAAG